MDRVAAFTDTYLPTVNGVTYTVETWHRRWRERGGRMDVVYPGGSGHEPGRFEHPVRSVPFPCYEGFRFGFPTIPDSIDTGARVVGSGDTPAVGDGGTAIGDVDLVHAHTPFTLGLAARRFAARRGVPLVASYHTPTREYASYVTGRTPVRGIIERLAARYESWYFSGADAVIAPSETTAEHLSDVVTDDTAVWTVKNGVDVDRFRPVEDGEFRATYGLGDGLLVGYTGRHGYEKQLPELLAAVDELDRDVELVIAGDGPARGELEDDAHRRGLDATFLGFLDREELPAFYSALDAFLFPSPVETQGLVALEANACGTPVVGVDSGALTETIDDGVTGYRYPEGETAAFANAIGRTLDERDCLRAGCLARREEICVAHAIDRLVDVYEAVRVDVDEGVRGDVDEGVRGDVDEGVRGDVSDGVRSNVDEGVR